MKKTKMQLYTHPLWALFVVPLPLVGVLVYLLIATGLFSTAIPYWFVPLLVMLAYLTVYAIRCHDALYSGAPLQTGILLAFTAPIMTYLGLMSQWGTLNIGAYLAIGVSVAMVFVWFLAVNNRVLHWALRIVSLLPYLFAIVCIVFAFMDIPLFGPHPNADFPAFGSPLILTANVVGIPFVLPISSTMTLFILTAKKL